MNAIEVLQKAYRRNAPHGPWDRSPRDFAADMVLVSAMEHLRGNRAIPYHTVDALGLAEQN